MFHKYGIKVHFNTSFPISCLLKRSTDVGIYTQNLITGRNLLVYVTADRYQSILWRTLDARRPMNIRD